MGKEWMGGGRMGMGWRRGWTGEDGVGNGWMGGVRRGWRRDGWVARAEHTVGFVGERGGGGVRRGWGRAGWEERAEHTVELVGDKSWGRGVDRVEKMSMGGEG